MRARSSADRNSWLFLIAISAIALTLGAFQWRWTNELSQANAERLQAGLQNALLRVSEDFNAELNGALAKVGGSSTSPDLEERARAVAERFARIQHEPGILRSVAMAIPDERRTSLLLKTFDPSTGQLQPRPWPPAWERLRDRLLANLNGRRGGAATEDMPAVVEIPIFPSGPGAGARHELGWFVFEIDIDWVQRYLLPSLLKRHLGGELGDSQFRVTMAADPRSVVFENTPTSATGPRAVARLFQPEYSILSVERDRPRPPAPAGGRWVLEAWQQGGRLEAVVNQGRWQNIAIVVTLLALLIAAAAALVRFTRRAQRLAELQIQFVAGVSHELKTPLAVMRTAGHNLRGPLLSQNPGRVRSYGALIEEESAKLAAIVESILRFAGVRSGHAISPATPTDAGRLVLQAVETAAPVVDNARMVVETSIEPETPLLIAAEEASLTSAVLNLIENAAKYGVPGSTIRVSAKASKTFVHIAVWNSGPPIRPDEMRMIFDPFVRGQRAISDQIHGTGLGLALVRSIVEAHGGTVTVSSSTDNGTEFVISLPAAVRDPQYATSNLAG